MMYRLTAVWIFFLTILVGSVATQAGYREDIGLTALQAELGANTPDGSGVVVSHVEPALDYPVGSTLYLTDSTDAEMLGKTFTAKSGTAGASWHATSVGRNWYGKTNGIAPGITQVDGYEAGDWLTDGFLHYGNNSSAPATETRRVENHSWISSNSESTDNELVRRFDFAIARDGFVAIVGVNNGSMNPVPALLASSYNAISVGVANGNHSHGGTTNDTPGRIKPEIVASSSYGDTVSYVCGVVSGAASVLLDAADASPALVNARTNSEVIKALLMAGATKTPYPGWARTPTQPIDLIYGAGRLNLQNSYHILIAGEQAPGSSVTVSNRGWDFGSTTGSPTRYFFDVPAGFILTNFSVILTWNRKIVDSNPGATFTMQVSVANLDLRLYSASGFSIGTVLDASLSTIQNVEHLYTNLPAGRYALEVTSDTAATDFGLAWGGGLQAIANVATTASPTNWGTIAPTNGTYLVGSSQSFIATPAPNYRFSHWSGSLTGSNTPFVLTLTSNMVVTATFVERFTTNHPTPYWWLGAYGYTINQETVIANLGANGLPIWQSYIAGLNPTNPASQLRFANVLLQNQTNLVMTWNTTTGRLYTIWTSTNLSSNFSPLPGAINLLPKVQSFTNPIQPPSARFYRLEAHLP